MFEQNDDGSFRVQGPEQEEFLIVSSSNCQDIQINTKPPPKSLVEFNAEKYAIYQAAAALCPNGIACPECSAELLDSNPMVTLLTYPPQMNVHCPACDYRGYRLA